ncbi:hypothetical protein GN956_G2447 [Arapaima gigas]
MSRAGAGFPCRLLFLCQLRSAPTGDAGGSALSSSWRSQFAETGKAKSAPTWKNVLTSPHPQMTGEPPQRPTPSPRAP